MAEVPFGRLEFKNGDREITAPGFPVFIIIAEDHADFSSLHAMLPTLEGPICA